MHDAFFAGFFDADGCVTISEHGGKQRQTRISVIVTQVHVEPLVAFQERFGGRVGRNHYSPASERHRPRSDWRVLGQAARPFLDAVLPYVIVKRSRVKLALRYLDLGDGRRGAPSDRTRQEQQKLREARAEIAAEMRVLNRRGPTAPPLAL